MVIDRQGDPVMELAVAGMMQAGVIKSHARKVLRAYAGRRLAFTRLLGEARRQMLILSSKDVFAASPERVQGARMGFASMNEAELAQASDRLRRALEQVTPRPPGTVDSAAR